LTGASFINRPQKPFASKNGAIVQAVGRFCRYFYKWIT